MAVLLLSSPVFAVVVDRVAVSLGNLVITTSEIEERIRLTALQNGATPDFRVGSLKEAAERLIDQKLIAKEMLLGRYSAMTDAQSAPLLTQFVKEHFSNEQEFRQTLRQNELTAVQLQRDLARQADLLTFLNLRFRPAVQVTDDDVKTYYVDNIEAKSPSVQSPPLEDVRSTIEETLTNQRADKELETWLKDQRRRLKIEYHADAFEPSSIGATR